MTVETEAHTQAFQLTLPYFAGSADRLLHVVSQRKLAADLVSLTEVTAQFLQYLEREITLDLQETGDFVATSARLAAMKSSFLMLDPEPEVEAIPPPSIGAELRTAVGVAGWWLLHRTSHESFPAAGVGSGVDRPITPRSVETLSRVWQDMLARSERVRVVAVPSYVRLEVAVSHIIRRLHTGARFSFQSLSKQANRRDAVVYFLAMLELVRRGKVSVDQESPFADIGLKWVAGDSGNATRAG